MTASRDTAIDTRQRSRALVEGPDRAAARSYLYSIGLSDEEGLIRRANMHLPGRQVDPQQVRRDLWRLAMWERERGMRRSTAPAAMEAAG